MPKRTKKELPEPINELIDVGSNIAGGASAVAIGLLTGGVEATLLSAASAPLLIKGFQRIGTEIKNRFLGKREEMRIGAACAYAIVKTEEHLKNGKQSNTYNTTHTTTHTRGHKGSKGSSLKYIT